MKFNEKMYQYLAWLLFKNVFTNITEWDGIDNLKIDNYIKQYALDLSDEQIKAVNNRAMRLVDEYHKNALYTLKKMYWNELEDGHRDFIKYNVDYNQEHYNIWILAVKKKRTVKMKYDSQTSGITDRLVDPYSTRSPYRRGFLP